jgi:peroxiredoxin
MSRLLAVGNPAPDFEARGSDGRAYVLSRLLEESNVWLRFYPGNDTPG